jgi:hypothetical protein
LLAAELCAVAGVVVWPWWTGQVREHLVDSSATHLREHGHGMIKPGHKVHLRWNSQVSRVACGLGMLDVCMPSVDRRLFG